MGGGQAETQTEGEACWETDLGLDLGSPGSRPGPKAGAKPLSYPGIPLSLFFYDFIYSFARDTQGEAET